MPLSTGTKVGVYEIVSPIGAGGMGEVYRARDTTLNRPVAIKALHATVAQDPDRVARFEREAQILAALNHPHIAAIHGTVQADGATYLVLEFVDGRPLSDVLQESGALPVGETLRIARQMADALAASHERGIIHRDLKPGNVMLTADGDVKVLDFGLGKALEADGVGSAAPGARAAHSPTMAVAATQAGFLLGTAGYMSPEQARGRDADRRSDVWAFGCVLFELLTGRRAFDGEDITETLAAIVRGDPDWAALPRDLTPSLRRLLERCLVKNRADRLPDMSVVRFLLAEPAITDAAPPAPASAAPASAAPPGRARGRSIGLGLAVGLVTLAVLATAGLMRLAAPAAARGAGAAVAHLAIELPDGDEIAAPHQIPLAVSPDGTLVAYVALRAGKTQIYLRTLADREAKPLAGTDGAWMPFFSPDGQWIAFFAHGRLTKVSVGGAGLQVLADAPVAVGGAWGTDGYLYFTPTNITGLLRVSANGGPVAEVTRPDRANGEISHRWPHLLPDGDTLLFTNWTGPGHDERAIVAHSLSSGERRVLVRGGDTPRYVDGHLVYTRLDKLFAVPWRPSQRDLGGAVPVQLREQPRVGGEGSGAIAFSDGGTVAYLRGGAWRYEQRLVWMDRTGAVEPLPVPLRNYQSVTLSPDERVAVAQIEDGTVGLWLYDFARGTLTPYSTPGSSQAPLWTPDGQRLIYRGTRQGYRNLYSKAADGTGDEERLTTESDTVQTPKSISPDGEWLVFADQGSSRSTGADILAIHLHGDRTPRMVVQTPARDLAGQVSPSGRWLAYESNVSGRHEIYVQPFPGPGASQPVSIDGGTEPLWSRDGRELFYVNGDALMVVDVSTGPAFSADRPRVLARGRFRPGVNGNTPYAVSADGRRFLRVQQVAPDPPPTTIEVVLNWSPVR